MALETEDTKQISNGVIQILNDCILTRGVKVQNLATFDIEYLFLNVRAKSVGESVEVNITCPDDGETMVEMDIDLDSIKVIKNKDHNKIINLDDTYSMKLKYPSFDQFIDNNFETTNNISDEEVTRCDCIMY